MLLKLLKMDFKATYRIFIGLYAALFITVGVQVFRIEIVNNIAAIMYTLLLTGILFVALASLVIYYNKSMFKTQAYLTHTLPASEVQILASKLFVSVVWSIITINVILLSIFLLIIVVGGNDFSTYYSMLDFKKFFSYISENLSTFILMMSLIVASITLVFSVFYMSLSIVNTRFVKKFKNFFAALIIFGSYWLLSYVNEKFMYSIDNDVILLILTYIIPCVICISITLYMNKNFIEVENV
ncbi:MAG: hypothetical protein RR646_00945 [Erysipelotrichaceae bacterium]